MDRSLSAILRPRSIAVVGASRQPQSIGREILHNLIQCGFTGPVYPVNPNAESVHSIKCYPSLRDIPGPVDLAVLVVPKGMAARVVDDAVARRVRGLVVITAGFIYGEGQAVIHSSKAPGMIQHEICTGQAEVEFHAFDATMFATVSGPVIG